jgi:hypothetical protein
MDFLALNSIFINFYLPIQGSQSEMTERIYRE